MWSLIQGFILKRGHRCPVRSAPLPCSQVLAVPKARPPPAPSQPLSHAGPSILTRRQGLSSRWHLPAPPHQSPHCPCRGRGSSVVWAGQVYLSLHLCPWSPARRPWAYYVQVPKTGEGEGSGRMLGRAMGGIHRKTRSCRGALASEGSGGSPLLLAGQRVLVPESVPLSELLGGGESPTQPTGPSAPASWGPQLCPPSPASAGGGVNQALRLISDEKGPGGREAGEEAALLA